MGIMGTVVRYETPSGTEGVAVFAPAIPGCVVRHRDEAHARRLVSEAIAAIEAEQHERAAFARVGQEEVIYPKVEWRYRYD